MGSTFDSPLFTVFPTIFIIFFIIFIALFLTNIVKNISEWSRNNRQPVLSVIARIVSKRAHHSHHNHNNHSTSSTTYYVTFEVESGDRMELRVSDREYGLLAEGDTGKLTFQGTRYQGFERDKNNTYEQY